MRTLEAWPALTDRLEGVGQWLAPLGLRLVLAWAFFGTERLLSLALLLGLATRFAAFGLLVLTLMALAAVHWPDGWATPGDLAASSAADGLAQSSAAPAVLFVAMLLPLLFHGGGKLSMDALFAWRLGLGPAQPWADFHAWGITLLALGLPLTMLLPTIGIALSILGAMLVAFGRWIRT